MISEAIKICFDERFKILETIAEKVVARKNANGDMQQPTFLAEIKELQEKADVYLTVLAELTSYPENQTEPDRTNAETQNKEGNGR